MGTKAEKARELFESGYNCSQSVFGAFCEDFGMDFNTALKISSSFGGGMGRLREVCGAVTGMFMAVGLKDGYTMPLNPQEKTEHYKVIQELADRFKEKNGSIICRELLSAAKISHSSKKSCGELVQEAAEILEKVLNSK